MAVTKNDLDAFHQFAEAKLATDGAESLQELFDVWEAEHPAPDTHARNVAAVRAAIQDMDAGDLGRPADRVLDEVRAELAGRRNP